MSDVDYIVYQCEVKTEDGSTSCISNSAITKPADTSEPDSASSIGSEGRLLTSKCVCVCVCVCVWIYTVIELMFLPIQLRRNSLHLLKSDMVSIRM